MRPAVTIRDAITHRRPGRDSGWHARAAFTLVELLVTMVIVAILAALTLAGLAGVRQGAKADKTRNTIRKIDAVIRPMYDSYRNRRVTTIAAGASARNYTQVLLDKRKLLVYEMPDQWVDVPTPSQLADPNLSAIFKTSAVRSYAASRGSPTDFFGSAECLYMILERSGYDPDALEFFRSDEIGDVDQDGKPEFLDGWGRPIAFLRWAPGFSSPIQKPDSVSSPDPLDPARTDQNAYALVPLIYSAGPDGALGTTLDVDTGYGLQTLSGGWLANAATLLPSLCDGPAATVGASLAGDEALDNITNHDLIKK